MDVRHSHGTEVHVVRACYEDDAADLIAVGGAHSVEILLLVGGGVFPVNVQHPDLSLARQNPLARPLQTFTLERA